jgi:hypothetical protein
MALPLLFLCLWLKADVVEPGHIKKQFSFTNLDKFPGYTFYYLHHSYHYDHGYHPNPADTVEVTNGGEYFVSEKGNEKETLLIRDNNGRYLRSDISFGGAKVVSPSTAAVVEVFEIVSMKNNKVKTKKLREISIDKEGKHTEVKKGLFGLGSWVNNDGFSSGLLIASISAMVGLIVFFMLKKRKPKYIPMTA